MGLKPRTESAFFTSNNMQGGKQEVRVKCNTCGRIHHGKSFKLMTCGKCHRKGHPAWRCATHGKTPADTPLGFPIWQTLVNPNITSSTTLGGLEGFMPTALAFATDPFSFWRGDLIFRFEIVCSAFHRGKLAIYHDPNWAQSDLINTNLSLNKQFFRIIDIQETQMIEFKVNWVFPRPWARTAAYPLTNGIVNPSFVSTALADYVNGFIGVTPFITLQSPDDSLVQVNCYVYAENMHVNFFSEKNLLGRTRRNEVEPLEAKIQTESLICHPDTKVILRATTGKLKKYRRTFQREMTLQEEKTERLKRRSHISDHV